MTAQVKAQVCVLQPRLRLRCVDDSSDQDLVLVLDILTYYLLFSCVDNSSDQGLDV